MSFYNLIIIPVNEYKNYRRIHSSIYTTQENVIKAIINYMKTLNIDDEDIPVTTTISDTVELFYELVSEYYIEVETIKPDSFLSEDDE